MVQKEIAQLRRDPRLLRLILVSPVIQLLVFGYAVSTDIRDTATYVVDLDRSRASRELIDAFTASGYFRVVGGSARPEDLTEALDRGSAVAGLEIPRGYARELSRGSAVVQILFDGTNSNVATVAMGYAGRIVQGHGARLALGEGAPLDLRVRAWFNPDLASRNYNVPAVLGLVVMLICLLLTSLAVVRERELGTLEQLMVSPLRPAELILGKTLPFAMIATVDLILVTLVARLWFHVPLVGSLLLFLVASLLYILCALAFGLFVSTISTTQREAFLSTFLFFMPTTLLSGFMFPVSSMPAVFQGLTWLNPMRHYLQVVRGVFLKDAGWQAAWPSLAALFLIGTSVLWVASRRFHKIQA
jgi:ABC-2 type transport system permease protein